MTTIEWFENICANIQSNERSIASAASNALEEFKESDIALTVSKELLNNSSLSDIAKFHALSIIQYVSLSRWETLLLEERIIIKSVILHVLSIYLTTDNNNSMIVFPKYVMNKALQVHISIWKRDWNVCNQLDKNYFFQHIYSLIFNTTDSIKQSIAGTMLLRVLIEEFSNKTYAEINLPFEFHIKVKKDFEINDLINVLILSTQALNNMFSLILSFPTNNTETNIIMSQLLLLLELLKLTIELISWDFNSKDNNSKDDDDKRSQIFRLPNTWKNYIVQSKFIGDIFSCYNIIKSLKNLNNTSPELSECLMELRNIIICLASIDGEIFSNDEEKLLMGNYIIEQTISLIDSSINRNIISSELSINSYDYENGDIRAEELELFLNITSKLIVNYKIDFLSRINNFEKMIITIGKVTFEISKELSLISKFVSQAINNINNTSGNNGLLKSFLNKYETKVLDSWRGDLLVLCLDNWCLILDDPLISGVSTDNNNTSAILKSENFKMWLKSISGQVFHQLFECTIDSYLFESFIHGQEEEDEDDEEIGSREVHELLSAISTIGRVSLCESLSLVNDYLNNTLAEANNLRSSNNSQQSERIYIINLEKLRLSIMFAGHLLIDTFDEDSKSTNSGESPCINSIIIELFKGDTHSNTISLLVFNIFSNIIGNICKTLELQVINNNSPVIIRVIFRFLTEFTNRYIDPDVSNYSSESIDAIIKLQNSFGDSFNQLIDVILTCAYQVMIQIPFEIDVIFCISEFLSALSLSKNQIRVQNIVVSNSVSTIASFITNQSYGGNNCRLNSEGYSHLFYGLSCLFIRSGNGILFTQLCNSIYSKVSNGIIKGNSSQIELLIACLQGVVRSPSGQDATLHSLVDACIPILKSELQAYVDRDDIVKNYLFMLRDYAENQISRLNNNSCFELYKSSFQLLQIYSGKFKTAIQKANKLSEEAIAFRNESILHILELLNQLTSKEFSFTEDLPEEISVSFEKEVSTVLFYGLQIIIPIVTVDILQYFQKTADKYFLFISFITATYMSNLITWIKALEGGYDVALCLVQHLVWGCSNVDGTTARLALQALQSIGLHQWNIMNKKSNCDGFDINVQSQLLLPVTDRLLQIAVSRGEKQVGVSWDRVDSFANTLITFISLDINYFQTMVTSIISKQTLSIQPTLCECLEQLIRSRSVDLNDISKRNRILFVQNFRDFTIRIKSLGLK